VPRQRSLYAIANERVPFDTAMLWAGVGGAGTRERGIKVTCPSCDEAGAMRVYPGHGWCFPERLWLTPVGLLAAKWDMDREEAAIRALKRIGYVPPGYAELFDQVQEPPPPARDDLATALRIWCGRVCPDWQVRQYDPDVAALLARCLGLLPKVQTAEDCRKWLEVSKTVMGRLLTRP
jgi:hypothetical protein